MFSRSTTEQNANGIRIIRGSMLRASFASVLLIIDEQSRGFERPVPWWPCEISLLKLPHKLEGKSSVVYSNLHAVNVPFTYIRTSGLESDKEAISLEQGTGIEACRTTSNPSRKISAHQVFSITGHNPHQIL